MWRSWESAQQMDELIWKIMQTIEESGMCAEDTDALLERLKYTFQKHRVSILADTPFKAYQDSLV